MVDLCCCEGLSPVAARGGHSPAAACGPLIAVASLVAELRLRGVWASVAEACGLSSCSSWSLEHRLSSCGTRP